MRIKLIHGLALAAAVSFAACDEGSTGPEEQQALDSGESEFIAVQTDDIVNSMLDDALGAYGDPAEGGVVMAADHSNSSEPVITNFTFERIRPCPVSGRVIATGEGQRVHYERTVEMSVSGIKHAIECARVRGDIVITIDGIAEFEAYRKRVEGQLVEANSLVNGKFEWETSNGRMGRCEYRVKRVFIPDANQIHVTGSVCGHEIDRVIDLVRDSA